jgi:hypothetical protein
VLGVMRRGTAGIQGQGRYREFFGDVELRNADRLMAEVGVIDGMFGRIAGRFRPPRCQSVDK